MATEQEDEDDDEHKRRKRKADADKAEFNVEILKGRYVLKSEVEKQAFLRGRTLRDNLFNIPDRVASLLAHESDEKECHKILTSEIREMLENQVGTISEPDIQPGV